MKNILAAAWRHLLGGAEGRAIEATRRQLLRLDDRTLTDIGISRALLHLGANAHPWQVEETAAPHFRARGRAAPGNVIAGALPATNDDLGLDRAA